MMNTRRTKLSMVRDDSQSSKTSNKKCPVVLHGDHIIILIILLKRSLDEMMRATYYTTEKTHKKLKKSKKDTFLRNLNHDIEEGNAVDCL